MIVGQLTNGHAARVRADQIDRLLVSRGTQTRRYDGPVGTNLPTAWGECDLLISHLALGATVRLLAPLLTCKTSDPGVVVIDDAGRYAIPVVGGHRGGANELAGFIAQALDAEAVLTTATDARGIPGLDTLGWQTSGDLAAVTRAVLDGEPVELDRDHPWPLPALPDNVTQVGVERVQRRGTHVRVLPPPAAPHARILITDRLWPLASNTTGTDSQAAETAPGPDLAAIPTVALHPKSLVVGIGCNRGTPADVISAHLKATLAAAGLSPDSVTAITSVDAKADEAGIIAVAHALAAEYRTYPAAELTGFTVPNPSSAAQTAVGTPSVAEASVLAYGAELIVEKRIHPQVTCAIGRIAPRGRLVVVGLGPGADDLLTPRARRALRQAALVVGYRPYVEQIRALLRPGTQIYATGMGTELARTRHAIDQARLGRNVAVVTSGDPGIYAMASPTLELGTQGLDVEIVPGVTAELAAAALLGAPLGNDHATISLSDLHTPWEVIERRLQAASDSDLVVSLYNPRSRKRVAHLPRALAILAAHRPANTPVAVVRDATRPEQSIRIATIATFDPAWVDMHSLVIVGSSTTRLIESDGAGAHMVTPRDYSWMPGAQP